MISRRLVEEVKDEATLLDLLRTSEEDGGLGWLVSGEFAFEETPEIAQGVKGEAKARVSRLIPSGTEGEWLILLAEFDQEFKRRDLREILRSLRAYARETARFPDHTGYGDTLFIVANPGYQEVRFVLFQQQEGRQARIRLFGWSAGELGRTLLEHNLPKLRWSQLANWAKAWDVEALTKQFFREISDLFYDAVEAILPKCADESEARLTVQTLFNRLLFLRFVEEKKGWLQYGDEPHYLQALWKAGEQSDSPLWPTRLNALFTALKHPSGEAATMAAHSMIGHVPFLNGGLFEQELPAELPIPKATLDGLIGINGLFYRYNFVVEESTPLDVELAIDPEMLGKIFEQLTNSAKRHDTGSYYTPREIVQFMCREALVGYLGTKGLPEGKARQLVYQLDDSEIDNQEGDLAFHALKEIKVVDPACGSGAYLLGMLQELYSLLEKLRRGGLEFSDDPAKVAHKRKLWIIENNIYGVDIQAFATNTAMLRLWLTLLVEDTGERPQPLPNLDYKIETGDALLGPDPSQEVHVAMDKSGQQSIYDTTIFDDVQALRQLRKDYQDAHGQEKLDVKILLESRLSKLRGKVTGSAEKDPACFDWRVEFFDVFLEDSAKRSPGFDVVVANPPYVRIQEIPADLVKILRRHFSTAKGKFDLYIPFMERAIQLMARTGEACLITPNKYLVTAYGEAIRQLVDRRGILRGLIDFSELQVFSTATNYVAISFYSMQQVSDPLKLRAAQGDSIESLIEAYLEDGRPIHRASSQLRDLTTLHPSRSCTSLGQYATAIFQGVISGGDRFLYLREDSSAARRILEAGEDEVLRPLLKGSEVGRYAKLIHRWRVIYPYKLEGGQTRLLTESEMQQHYPVTWGYLMENRKELSERGSARMSYPAWYALWCPRDLRKLSAPKIVTQVLARNPSFAIDESGSFVFVGGGNAGVYGITMPSSTKVQLLFTLGVLNSSQMNLWARRQGTDFRGGYMSFGKRYIEGFPFPITSDYDRDAIAALTQQCLDVKATDPDADISSFEHEIDARVEFLYFHRGERGTRPNVVGEEVPYPDTYDEWVALREAEAGTIVGEIRQLIAKGESGTVEFKQSLQFVDPDSFSHVPEAHRKHKMAEDQKGVLHAALKTICAFANTKGGTLLIGVHDSGDLWGLDGDFELSGGKRDQDAFENRLTDLIKTRIRPLLTELEIAVVKVDGKWVCRVYVPSAKAPHYLDNKLYIRLGNSTEELAGRDLEDWLANR